MLHCHTLPATSAPAPAKVPGYSPAILSPTPSSSRLVHGRRALSAVRISFCFVLPSSPRQAFFVVSRRHSRSCFLHVSFRASEEVASSQWRRPSWLIRLNRRNEVRHSRYTASSPCLRHLWGRRSAVGSRTTTLGDGSSTSICLLALLLSFWSVVSFRILRGSRPTTPTLRVWITSA